MTKSLPLKILFVAFACLCRVQGCHPDSSPPKYVVVEGLQGSLEVYGHSSIANVLILLVDAFQRQYPQVTVQVEPILIGESLFADGPRMVEDPVFMIDGDVSPADLKRLKELPGKMPVDVNVFAQAVYILVNKSNPLNEISTDLLKSLYFGTGNITWGELGVSKHDLSGKKVSVHGMGDLSNFTLLFKDKLGMKERLNDAVVRSSGLDQLLQAVQTDPHAIGFAGHASSDVKALSIQPSNKDASGFSPPLKTAGPNYGAGYPLARIAKLYSPQGAENRLHQEFLKFVLSETGVQVMAGVKFVLPLDEADYQRERLKLKRGHDR